MKEYLLKEIANVKNGYAFDSSKYSDKGIPIIRIADIKDNIDLSKCVCIDEEINKEFLIKKGSLLIALSGATTGKMSVFSDNKIAYLNQRICSIYTKNEDISQEFLIYFLKSIQKKIIVNSYGGAQPNISSKWIENIKIKVPNIEIQKKISKKLELLANSINSRKSQLVFLKELTKSLFTRMFGDIKTNDKNWKIIKLEKYINIIGGYAFKNTDFKSNGIPLIRIGNINSGNFKNTNLVFIKENPKFEKFKVFPNDILISLTGTVGKDDYGNACILRDTYPEYYLNQRNAKIILTEKIEKNFFLEIIKIKEVKKKLTGISRGIRQANISNKDIYNLSIPLPPIELQNKFAERIEKIEKLKFEIEKSIEIAQNLYDSLKERWHNGKIYLFQ